MSKKTLITGTLVLTSANLITKFMGFFYRVYMAKTIGNEGMGLYQLILPIYMLTWSITSSGFTTTISKLTAQEKAKGHHQTATRILKQSIFISLLLSFLVSTVLFFGSDFLAIHIIKEPRTSLSLKLLAFAIPFMSSGSCMRGYFLGLQNTVLPALSQVLEQIIRIVVIFLIASYFVPKGLDYACAAAVIGIIFGEIISFLFTFCGYLLHQRKQNRHFLKTQSKGKTLSMILSMALPLTASRISSSILSTTENILIPQRLQLYGQSSQLAMSTYGQLTGMAMPLLMLPSALLMAISVSLVPEISKASAIHDKEKIARTVSATLLFTSILSIGSGTMFAIFPKEICYVVYNNVNLGDLLFRLSFICPFLYLQMTFSGLLNGLGEHLFIFSSNIFASVITIGFIYFFMPIFGVNAFLVGWLLSLLLTTFLSMKRILSRTHISINPMNVFGKPLLAGLASGLMVRYLIQISTPSKIFFLLTLILMFLLYVLFLLILGCLKEPFRLFFAKK